MIREHQYLLKRLIELNSLRIRDRCPADCTVNSIERVRRDIIVWTRYYNDVILKCKSIPEPVVKVIRHDEYYHTEDIPRDP